MSSDYIIAKRVAERFVRGLSSAGRASALQAEGHRFEPYRPQQTFISASVINMAR